MFLQIRKFRVISGSAEELCRQAAENFLPLVKNVRGFVDYIVVDNHDGNVMSISICQDQAGVQEIHQLAIDWHRQYSKQLEGPLETINGDVIMDASGFRGEEQPRMAA